MTLSTSRTRATFCSPCRNVNPATGLCKGYPGAIVRPYQTPLSTHSNLFQSSFSKPSPHDNGGEFARHKKVEEKLGMPAYFCEPHSPWQRGAVENGNGRLRIDLPRKTKLSNHTDQDIQDLAMLHNNTPRKCLGYRTPLEAILSEINKPGCGT